MMRVSQQMPTKITGAKIACLDMNLNKFRMQMGVMISVSDPKNLEKIRQRECDILKERCEKIIKAGANVVLTTKGVDDIAAKYFVEAGVLALRRVDKNDLRRIAKSTGGKIFWKCDVLSIYSIATILTTFADPEKEGGEEKFDSSFVGEAQEVYEETVGDNDFIFIQGFKHTNAVTILLRGANEFMLDEIERYFFFLYTKFDYFIRSVHDSLCVVKRCIESGYVVAGGGAVEIALNIYLEDFARSLVMNF